MWLWPDSFNGLVLRNCNRLEVGFYAAHACRLTTIKDDLGGGHSTQCRPSIELYP